jgi:hypothetical protein
MPAFLYPAFLLGALAIAIPVFLHLLRHQQAQEVRFSAVRLLQGVRVEHVQRRRVRDWLLLVLRAAALLLLAVAFARPYVLGEAAARGPATVIALDRSASMAPVWAQAIAAARQAIDARAGERVGLIAFDDRAELVAEPTLDHASVQAALAGLAPGAGGTQYPGAFSRAAAVLQEADAEPGRIVVVSDLQGGPADARGAVPEPILFEVIGVAAPFDNLALLAARHTRDGVAATVRNDGIEERRVRVVVEADGRQLSDASVTLPPGAVRDVMLPAASGDELCVRIDGEDAITADNVRYLFRGEAPRTRVAIVAGPGDAFYLDAALRAEAEAPDFDVSLVSPASVAAALARRPPPQVVMLVSPRGVDRLGREALAAFVEQGGGLLVAAGADAADAMLAPLLDRVQVTPRAEEAALTLGGVEARHPLLRRLGGAEEGLVRARFTGAWRVRADGWTPLAWFDDGSGALYERAMGQGRMILFASDLNRRWNDLPVQPAFVPLVQELARHLAPRPAPREFTTATAPPGTAAVPGFVGLPTGARAAINADARESDPARMSAEEFVAAVRRSPAAATAAAPPPAAAAESSQGLWRYALMVMLAALVVEGLLAGRPGGVARAGGPPKRTIA